MNRFEAYEEQKEAAKDESEARAWEEQDRINRYVDQCPRPLVSGQVKDTLTGTAHAPEVEEVNPFESPVTQRGRLE